MKIQVIGAGCDKCAAAYDHTVEAVEQLGLDAEIQQVDDLIEIVKMGIFTTPAIVVDGVIVDQGRVPKTKAIVKLLQKRL